jgi:hypothetical protein
MMKKEEKKYCFFGRVATITLYHSECLLTLKPYFFTTVCLLSPLSVFPFVPCPKKVADGTSSLHGTG